MKGEITYYKILGVNENASNNELRKAFCKLSIELHPDTTSLELEDAKNKFQKVFRDLSVMIEEDVEMKELLNCINKIKIPNFDSEGDIYVDTALASNRELKKNLLEIVGYRARREILVEICENLYICCKSSRIRSL